VSLVVDASVIAFFVMPDEGGDAEHPIYDHLTKRRLIAPELYWYEIRNIALKNLRRGRLPQSELEIILAAIEAFPIELKTNRVGVAAAPLASKYALSFYDACYLALAIGERALLATLDASLARAARSEGVLLET
jgi:predicted nucleic acid-binding protein